MKRQHESGKLFNWLALGSSLLLLSSSNLPLIIFSDKVFAQETVQQLPEERLEQLARSITVKIIVENSGGSGVIIKKEGQTYTVLTNAHVVSGTKSITLETADGKKHQARLVPLDFQKKDLALLQFTSPVNYAVASLGNLSTIQKGDQVFIAGFPFQDNASAARQFVFRGGEHGRVSFVLPKPLQGGYRLGYTNEVEKGMSGGPILNRQGEVIGINGLHAQPLWGNPYVYEDGENPSEELSSEMKRSSWGVPIEVIAQIAPNYAPTITQSKPAVVSTTSSQSMSNVAKKVEQIAQEISVLITWPTDKGTSKNGTGVIIAHEGQTYYVVTAKHVAANEGVKKIVTHDGQVYQSQSVELPAKIFEGKDLALLKFTSNQSYRVATIGDYTRSADTQLVFVSGWPGVKKTSASTIDANREFTAGYLFGFARGNNRATDYLSLSFGYGLVYTNITDEGMSGGAVLDHEGRLLGIHTASEGRKGDQAPILEDPTAVQRLDYGYSLGVPIQSFTNALKQGNIQLKLMTNTTVPNPIGKAEADQIVTSLINLKEPDSKADKIAWLNYGNKLWRLRRYEEAQGAFDKSIKIKPTFEAWYGHGLALVGDKENVSDIDWQKSINSFKKAQEIEPNSDIAWRQIGDSYWYLGDYQQALEAFKTAIKIRPRDFILYNWIANAYQGLGLYTEALEAGNKAIEINSNFAENYYRRGETYSLIGDYTGAIADADRAIKLDPNLGHIYRLRATFRVRQEREQKNADDGKRLTEHDKIFADFDQAIKLSPDDPYNYSARGSFYAQIGNREQFQKDFDQALRLAPDDASVYQVRGYSYYLLGNKEKALADYTAAIRIAPESAHEFYTDRGEAQRKQGENEAAIQDFTAALSFRSNYIPAHLRRGIIYAKLGQKDKAFQDLNEALRLAPENTWTLTWLGDAYFYLGEKEQGYQEYQKAISKSPDLAYIFHIARGNVLADIKDYEGAIKDYTAVIRLKPGVSNYYSRRAGFYQNQEKYPEAIADYNEAIKLDPKDAFVYGLRGFAYHFLTEAQKALEDFNQAIALSPKFAGFYSARGVVYDSQGKYPEAIADHTKAIELEPNNAVYYSNRGNSYRRLKENQKALDDYTKAIALAPKNSGIYNVRGIVYENQGKYPEAIADYTKAIELEPNNAVYYSNRGNSYRRLKENQKALADLNQAIVFNPKFATAYNVRGIVYDDQGKHQEAIADYTKAIELEPNNAVYYSNRADSYRRLKEEQKALADFNQAIAINPKSAVYHVDRAESYISLAKFPEAINDLDAAIKLNPNFQRAFVLRGDARKQIQDYQGALEDYNQGLSQAAYGRIGANLDFTEEVPGLIVTGVVDGSPAQKGGLQVNDQIIAIDEVSTLNKTSAQRDELISQRIGGRAGTNVTLTIERAGRQLKLTLTIELFIDPEFAIAYYNRGLLKAQLGDSQGAKKDLQTSAELYQKVDNTQMYQTALEKLKEVE